MAKISKIEPNIPKLKKRKKAAAYCRVPEESERMLHSVSAQISYYNNLIQNNPDWEYAGVYADSFISGTSTAKRSEFNRMISDCDNGKIDIILCKSISRFASFAQKESRSISENVKWGTRKRFEKGIPNGKFKIYGYRWNEDTLVVQPDEAGVKSYNGGHFGNTAIRHILSNITYTGNLLLQKEYVSDPITGLTKKNCGEFPQYFVENTHEAIIPLNAAIAIPVKTVVYIAFLQLGGRIYF